MGLDRMVPLAKIPEWERLKHLPLQLRMIDGELAFPDEVPPADWRELRVAVPAGMITLRRVPDGVNLVVWGNADAELMGAVEHLATVLATSDPP